MRTILFRIGLLAALLFLLPAVVRAQFTQGQFTYTTNNGTATITQYADDGSTDVTIPNTIGGYPVTGIGQDAFFQCQYVTSVTMGTNVTTIGENAFFQCYALVSASLPGSVTNIGQAPFWDCQKMTTISFSSSNAFFTVTNGALYNKSVTSLIQVPCGVSGNFNLSAVITNIGAAFIGNTLTSISADPANPDFTSTNGVLCTKPPYFLYAYPGGAPGSYTIPGVITNIVSGAFEYSPGITSVYIGTNVLSIGYAAFYDCSSMTSITVNPTNAYYTSTNGVLYDKAEKTLIQYPVGSLAGSYSVLGTVTDIGVGAFGDAVNLTSVFIPDSVGSIEYEAFYFCENLTSVSIPDSVTNIADYAFLYCPNLESVTFGSRVASIGQGAFSSCNELESACFEGNEPVDGGDIFSYDDLSTILYVNGTSGWGPYYDGIATAPCPSCGGSVPQLGIVVAGTNVLVGWSADFSGYTLQSSTNLAPSAVWGTVSPAPAVVNDLYVVTNSMSGREKFYRLMQNP